MSRLNRKTRVIVGAACVVFVICALLASVVAAISIADTNSSASASGSGNGSSAAPFMGNAGNQDPVLPSQVESWKGVVSVGENPSTAWYQNCVTTRLDVTWDQVKQAAKLESQGALVQGILVSNTATPSDPWTTLEQQLGVKVDRRAPIIKVGGFDNTAGLPTNRCSPFPDGRGQVRLTLLLPAAVLFPGTPLSQPLQDRGVLMHCGNPWRLLPKGTPALPVPKPSPSGGGGNGGGGGSSTTTTTIPPTTTTTKCILHSCNPFGNPDSGGKFYNPPRTPPPDKTAPNYTPGTAEGTIANQNPSGVDPNKPHTGGTQTGGSTSGPSGGTTGPSGTDTGGTQGVSNPQGTTVGGGTTMSTSPPQGDPGAP